MAALARVLAATTEYDRFEVVFAELWHRFKSRDLSPGQTHDLLEALILECP